MKTFTDYIKTLTEEGETGAVTTSDIAQVTLKLGDVQKRPVSLKNGKRKEDEEIEDDEDKAKAETPDNIKKKILDTYKKD